MLNSNHSKEFIMQFRAIRLCLTTVLALALASCANKNAQMSTDANAMQETGWTDHFNVSKENFTNTGRCAYFVLEPGYQMTYEGKEDGKPHRLVITVLKETKWVDGVETRVIEEHETENGALMEISRNYFAMDKSTGDVYYFGEDVDMYKNGKVTGHGGSWQSGVKGAHYGLAMPGSPKLGQMYYQELAPGQAMDRAKIVSVTKSQKTPAGEFSNCVRTEETTPLEPGSPEYKLYASGVGLIVDGDLVLVKYGKNIE